jgi:MFS family permease
MRRVAVPGAAICGCLVLTVAWGLTYSMPVLFPALAARFAIPAWHLAACFSAGGFVFFSIGGLTGAAADRYGTHVVAGCGLLLAAGGFLLASFARTEWLFASGYVVGISSAVGCCYAPVTGAVQVLTPPEQRIVAAGITSAGVGFATMLPPLLTAWLDQAANWRAAMQGLAVLALIGSIPVLRLAGAPRRTGSSDRVSPFRAHPNFAWAFAGQVLFAIMYFVPVAHLVNLTLWFGWGATEGVTLISLLGIFSTAGRFLVTPVAERLGACRSAALCTSLATGAMAGIALAQSHWMLWLNVAVFGLAYGAVIALSAPIVTEICGTDHISRNVGVLMGGRAVGILVGPWSVGYAEFYLKTYEWPLLGSALAGAAATLCLVRAGWRPVLADAETTIRS